MIHSVFIGPLRIVLLIMAVMFLHQLITRQPLNTYSLDYLVKRIVVNVGLLLVLVAVLVQLNMYDIFSILVIFAVGLGAIYLHIGFEPFSRTFYRFRRSRFLLRFFKFMERDLNFREILASLSQYFKSNKINYAIVLVLGCSIALFISRFQYLENDLYTLSTVWVRNLETLKNFNDGFWFSKEINVIGELALINLYAKITNIGGEMAIHSFGLLENVFVGVVIFWILKKLFHNNYTAGIGAVLFYGFYYQFLPVNINLVLQHNPVLLAMALAIPAMAFILVPEWLTKGRKKFFARLFIIFLAISFINYYVTLFMVPLFLAILAPFALVSKNRNYFAAGTLAFVIATGLNLAIHYLVCLIKGEVFLYFLKRNLLLIDFYTFSPQLTMSLSNLHQVYITLAIVFSLLYLGLVIVKGKNYLPRFVLGLFIMAYLCLYWIDFEWFDKDLFYLSLSVAGTIMVGLWLGTINTLFLLFYKKGQLVIGSFMTLGIIAYSVYAYNHDGFYKAEFKKTSLLKSDLLEIYSAMSREHLPYSYAVVNQSYGLNMARNGHFYINYHSFLENYDQRDDDYQTYRDDKEFLRKNPEYILPHSVFVIVSQSTDGEGSIHLVTPPELIAPLEEQIRKLQYKGRKVKIYFSDEALTVYEIVNEEASTQLIDLIFKT